MIIDRNYLDTKDVAGQYVSTRGRDDLDLITPINTRTYIRVSLQSLVTTRCEGGRDLLYPPRITTNVHPTPSS